ncbi:MAG: right-handed parallel beta-helix repeat-containing protein [Pseudomonadota bacterium]
MTHTLRTSRRSINKALAALALWSLPAMTARAAEAMQGLAEPATDRVDEIEFADLPSLLADARLTYAPGEEGAVGVGDVLRVKREGYAYQIAPPAGSDHDLTTQGGIRLSAIASNGVLECRQMGLKGIGDETALLQRAVNRAVERHSRFRQSQKIHITPVGITCPPRLDWEFVGPACLEMLAHNSGSYQMIRCHLGANDILLRRPVCNGRRDLNAATTGEWGMGISLRGCKNITVIDPQTDNCWGDGIYLGSIGRPEDTDYAVNQNVTIIRPRGNNNRRQGMSIISGADLLVEDSYYTNTNGSPPQCAIDIEPNNWRDVLHRIRIVRPKSSGNKNAGLMIHLGTAQPPTPSDIYNISISIIDMDSNTGSGTPDGYGLIISGNNDRPNLHGTISAIRPRIVDTPSTAILFSRWWLSNIKVLVEMPEIVRAPRPALIGRKKGAILFDDGRSLDKGGAIGQVHVVSPTITY